MGTPRAELDTAISQMRVFLDALPGVAAAFNNASPEYITLAAHPSLQCTDRGRFSFLDAEMHAFMHRPPTPENDVVRWLKDTLSSGASRGAYLQGPQGIGKSHLLYEAVVHFFCEPAGYRVVYISDCKAWGALRNQASQATQFFIRAVAMACVRESDAELLQLCRDISERAALLEGESLLERIIVSEFLPRLGDLLRASDLRLFFIFDQHNGLSVADRGRFPFNLPELGLLQTTQLRLVSMVVVSASANNQYFLKVASIEPPWPTMMITDGFTEAEAALFLSKHNVIVSTDDMEQLRYVTNFMPLELDVFCAAHDAFRKANVPDCSIRLILQAYEMGSASPYIIGRRQTMEARVRLFHSELAAGPDPEFQLKGLRNSIVCMDYGLPLSSFQRRTRLDYSISFLSSRPHWQAVGGPPGTALDYIRPVTPLALDVAKAFYAHEQGYAETEVLFITHAFTSAALSPDVKGRVLEQYIVSQLARPGSTLLIRGRVILMDGTSSKRIYNLVETSRPFELVRWYGNDVPLLSNLGVNSPTLFWPHSPTYPGVDALIWIPEKKTLWLAQITLSAVGEHKSNIWAEQPGLQSRWRATLGGISQDNVKGLWIAPCADGRPQNRGQHVCTLQMLLADNASRFHLLEHFGGDGEVAVAPPKKQRT